MKKINKLKAALLIILITIVSVSQAQDEEVHPIFPIHPIEITSESHLREVLTKMYYSYDSIPNLSFDLNYKYKTDTPTHNIDGSVADPSLIMGQDIYDEMQGHYTMNGRNALFNLGDVEFMQNDSFFIAVYHTDKMLLVTNSNQKSAGYHLPMRALLDSLSDTFGEYYSLGHSENDLTGTFHFSAKNNKAQFESFSIAYDKALFVLTRLHYNFWKSQAQVPHYPEGGLPPPIAISIFPERRKALILEFTNYHFSNLPPETFDENSYIFQEDGEIKPVEKYKEFRVFNTRQ